MESDRASAATRGLDPDLAVKKSARQDYKENGQKSLINFAGLAQKLMSFPLLYIYCRYVYVLTPACTPRCRARNAPVLPKLTPGP